MHPPHSQLGGWLSQNNLLPTLQLPNLGNWQLPSLSQLFTANPVLDKLAQGLQADGQLLQDMQGDNVKQAAQEVATAFAGLFSKA